MCFRGGCWRSRPALWVTTLAFAILSVVAPPSDIPAEDTTMSATADPWFQSLFADRIGGVGYGKGTEIYKFEKIKRAKRAALQANPGAELIDMGVGEPDEMAFPECVEALAAAAKKPE